MNYIKEILKKNNPSIEELINCFEEIRKNGDVAVIKFDGERKENQYTIFISFPSIKNRDMIRIDISNLKNGLIKILNEYSSVSPDGANVIK